MTSSTNAYIRMRHASIVNRKVKLKSTQTRICSCEWEPPLIHPHTHKHLGCRECHYPLFCYSLSEISIVLSVAQVLYRSTSPPECTLLVNHFVFSFFFALRLKRVLFISFFHLFPMHSGVGDIIKDVFMELLIVCVCKWDVTVIETTLAKSVCRLQKITSE